MAVFNHTGFHLLNHLKPAMNLLSANVQKVVLNNANAEQHHCSVLLYVSVSENIRECKAVLIISLLLDRDKSGH